MFKVLHNYILTIYIVKKNFNTVELISKRRRLFKQTSIIELFSYRYALILGWSPMNCWDERVGCWNITRLIVRSAGPCKGTLAKQVEADRLTTYEGIDNKLTSKNVSNV